MHAGSARIDITPPKGLPMGGYFARAEPAEDAHDPLFARALVLDDGRERVAVLTADVPDITTAFATEVRQRIESQLGIPATHTLVAVTHTHAGPLVANCRVSVPDPGYVGALRANMVAAARAAAERLAPARVGAGSGKVYLGVNRRERGGGAAAPSRTAGYVSPFARILLVAAEGGGPLATLFTYGAHPNVLGPENRRVSGDYAGCAARVVEEDFGGTVTALFAVGFAGDVDARCAKRNFDEVDTLGTALGRTVLENIKGIEPAAGLPVRARVLRVPLPVEPPPPLDAAERRLFAERERLAAILGRGEDKTEILRRRAMVDLASELVKLARGGGTDWAVDLELQAITIGRAAIIALSAEPFAQYEKELLELSPFEHTFTVGCANGNIGHLPTADGFGDGGYDAEAEPCVYGALPLRPEAAGVVRQALVRLLAEITG